MKLREKSGKVLGFPKTWLGIRGENLDRMLQVATHPVGGSDEEMPAQWIFRPVVEIEQPGVF